MERSPLARHKAVGCLFWPVSFVIARLKRANMVLPRRILAEMSTELANGLITPDRLDYYERHTTSKMKEKNPALFEAARFSASQPPRPQAYIDAAQRFLSRK